MIRYLRHPVLALLMMLAACTGGTETLRYNAPTVVPETHVGIRYTTVSLREVSLPSYASAETIAVLGTDGRIGDSPEFIWADDPVRAVSLGLARSLSSITRARVAPDPWPYRSDPEVSVDIRLDVFVAEVGGSFRASGQYFVAPYDELAPERAGSFSLTEPFDPGGGFPAIAEARARIVAAIALHVARRSLR